MRHRVSIHAPARGATVALDGRCIWPVFRSTLPRGERPATIGIAGLTGFVSIHAPARGATKCWVACAAFGDVSIHAPARGATCAADAEHKRVKGFDPRSRAGSDCRLFPYRYGFNRFDPRSRAGSDHPPCRSIGDGLVSIHAPARGATASASTPGAPKAVSIHAPARGATRIAEGLL